LSTLSRNNELIKLADDSIRFGPREFRCQCECGNIILLYTRLGQSANGNSMIINLAKGKEIIFYNPRVIPISIPDLIYMALNEYLSAKLLGVYIQRKFRLLYAF